MVSCSAQRACAYAIKTAALKGATKVALQALLFAGAARLKYPTLRLIIPMQGAFEGVNGVAFSSDSKLVLAADNKQARCSVGLLLHQACRPAVLPANCTS